MNNYLKILVTIVPFLAFYTQSNDSIDVSRFLIDGKLKTTTWQLKDSKPKGIILISHGFSSRGGAMSHYAIPLAEAGYLVGAVSHEDIPNLQSNKPESDPMVIRQQHLKNLLNTLKKDNDNLPVGLLGYSLGGFSVLSATGRQSQFSGQPKYCQSDSGKIDEIICNPRFGARMKVLSGQERSNDREIKATASVLFAPAYLPLLKNSENTTPTLIVYGEDDELIAPQTIKSFIDGKKYFTTYLLKNAGHFVYLSACEEDSEICKDPNPINRKNIHAELAKKVVSFFNEKMKK